MERREEDERTSGDRKQSEETGQDCPGRTGFLSFASVEVKVKKRAKGRGVGRRRRRWRTTWGACCFENLSGGVMDAGGRR